MTRRTLLRLVLALGVAPFSGLSAPSASPREPSQTVSAISASPREPSQTVSAPSASPREPSRTVSALSASPREPSQTVSAPSASSREPSQTVSAPSASPREPSPRAPRETLHAISSLPPFLSGRFPAARAFERVADGSFYVFDPRAHAVYGIDPAMQKATRIVQIGSESGRVLQPTAFASESSGTFAVADAPNRERIQVFASEGTFLSGFFPSGAPRFEVVLDGLVLGGVGSLQYNGEHILISEPAGGALISEYSASGDPIRSFGILRPSTLLGADPEVVTLLNTGLPLFDPQGGYAFVFQTGVPLFRRYDRDGHLLFERHIEGPEIDPLVNTLPTTWPSRPAGSHEIPVPHPIVRTAAFDRQGNLWVALVLPYIYVYGPTGEKIRTIQLRTPSGVLAATSLFFDEQGKLLVTPGCYIFDP